MLIKKSYLTKHMWSVNIEDKFKEIKEVQSQKILGITIDEHLNWNTNRDKLCSSLKSSSYLFNNLVKYCDIETLKTVYHSYFESKIKYVILSWGVTKKQNITSKCQKRILRIINKAQYLDSCRVIFKKLWLLTVPGFIMKEACLLVKENLRCLNDSSDRERVYNTSKKETRITKNDDFESKLNFCIHIYNKLPENLIKEENSKIFKRRVTEYLCGRCLYSIDEFLEQ